MVWSKGVALGGATWRRTVLRRVWTRLHILGLSPDSEVDTRRPGDSERYGGPGVPARDKMDLRAGRMQGNDGILVRDILGRGHWPAGRSLRDKAS